MEKMSENLIDAIKEAIGEANPQAIVFDGLDQALIGVAEQHAHGSFAAYSKKKILQCLIEDNQWSEEEAYEWFDFNIGCLSVTNGTPVIIDDILEEG